MHFQQLDAQESLFYWNDLRAYITRKADDSEIVKKIMERPELCQRIINKINKGNPLELEVECITDVHEHFGIGVLNQLALDEMDHIQSRYLSHKTEEIVDLWLHMLGEMPQLSPTVRKIIAATTNPDTSPATIVKLLETTPILSARIMSLVNSSYISPVHKLSNLQHAIMMLGFDMIRSIALAYEILAISATISKKHYKQSQQLLSHLVEVAVTSRWLLKQVNAPRQEYENAFFAGLLHDVGEFVLLYHIPQSLQEVKIQAEEDEEHPQVYMKDKMGFNAYSITLYLSHQWNLGSEFNEVIDALDGRKRRGSKIESAVFLANALSECDLSYKSIRKKCYDEDWVNLELDPSQLIEGLPELAKEIKAAKIIIET